MNRQNFLGHLALALTLILLAAFAGQIRRWQYEPQPVTHVRYELRGEPMRQESAAGLPARSQVLVHFRPGTRLEKIKELALAHHDRFQDEYENISGWVSIEDEDGLDAEAVAAEYRGLTGVVDYAEPNYLYGDEPVVLARPERDAAPAELDRFIPFNWPNDPQFIEQWSLANTAQRGGKEGADISALRAWEKTKGSKKVVVAVLDSGVDYTHTDLANNIWQRPAEMAAYRDEQLGEFDDLHGFNATDRLRDPMDDNGHGTHCAGIIGAEGDNGFGITGVNWNVEIMPLKFMAANGSGTTRDAIEAINYVIDRKRAGVNVRIISASWGSTQKSRALQDAIKRAGEEGILFIAAAGNSSADADRSPHYPAGYDLFNVLSVAALDRNDALASFSNYGAKSVHVAAPGKEILSTWLGGEFREASGTSMATPEVAGVAALILSVQPELSVRELRQRLLDSVDKLDSLKGKVQTGGRINAARAVGVK
ncbi:MAG TPA: S8 family serine peptidase [Pyrinomonadaceae bacterium]|jgi:subtilisin family serine protease